MVSDELLAAVIPRRDSVTESSEVRELVNSLQRITRAWMVGERETHDSVDPFGRIEDVTSDANGRIFVLDSRLNEVRILDRNGILLGRFGQLERGVRAFRSPSSIEARADGSVVVADRGNVLRTIVGDDSDFSLLREVKVDLVPEKMCLLDDRIFVRGWREGGHTIHEIDPTGHTAAFLRSFGKEYDDDVGLVREQLSDGFVACNEDAGVVVAAMELFPWIQGYSRNGQLLWTSKLSEFTQMQITSGTATIRGRSDTPFVNYSYRVLPHEVVVSLESLGEVVVLQTRFTEEDAGSERGARETIHTYVLDARSGEGTYAGTSVPRLTAVRLPYLYAVEHDPYERLVVYAMEGHVE